MNSKQRKRQEKKARDNAHREATRVEHVRASLPITTVGAEPQPCGECQACCEAIAIDAFGGKKNYERCQHQCETGCGVYATRPDECKQYWCFYSQGFIPGGVDMRPDKLGVLIDFRGATAPQGRIVETFVFWETRANAMQSPAVQKLIRGIRRKFPHCKIMYNEYQNIKLDANGRISRKSLL